MSSLNLRTVAAAAALLQAATAGTALAQQVAPAPAIQTASLPSAGAVAAFYNRWSTPLWFRGGAVNPAANGLVAILKRAQFDGLASGPHLASLVEAAIARAATGSPADVAAAEQVLSAAWVTYVQ